MSTKDMILESILRTGWIKSYAPEQTLREIVEAGYEGVNLFFVIERWAFYVAEYEYILHGGKPLVRSTDEE